MTKIILHGIYPTLQIKCECLSLSVCCSHEDPNSSGTEGSLAGAKPWDGPLPNFHFGQSQAEGRGPRMRPWWLGRPHIHRRQCPGRVQAMATGMGAM